MVFVLLPRQVDSGKRIKVEDGGGVKWTLIPLLNPLLRNRPIALLEGNVSAIG